MRLRSALLCLVLTATAVACRAEPEGRGAAASPSPSKPVAVLTPAAAPTAIDPREGGFDVQFGEYAIVLEAAAIRPGPVLFKVHNNGKEVHGFEIKREGASSSGRGSGDEFKHESNTFGPGETVTAALDLAPGIYEVECFVGNHDDLGMQTRLEVRADAPLVTASQAAPGAVAIKGFAFAPPEHQVAVGGTVRWDNQDPAPHTVTSDTGAFDSGNLNTGQDFSFTFATAGRFTYFCKVHPSMKGTVVATA